jgi:cell division protein FtsB
MSGRGIAGAVAVPLTEPLAEPLDDNNSVADGRVSQPYPSFEIHPVAPGSRPAVPGRRSRRLRSILALSIGTVALAAAGLFHVWVRLRVLQYEADLGIETRSAAELEEANHRLETEAAWLSRPVAIDRVARTRLGMIEPDPQALRALPVSPEESRALGLTALATPTTPRATTATTVGAHP